MKTIDMFRCNVKMLKGISSPQGRRITRMYKFAIKALEKQIAFTPINGINKNYPALGRNYYCKCGVMFIDWETDKTKYCGNCGQKLGRH